MTDPQAESCTEVDAMVEALRAQLDAAEWWAREASRKGGGDVPLGGVQWRWECPDHDVEMVPNPAVDETLRCPISEDCFSASLRSVEQFPTAGSDRPLPQFAVYSTDEQSAVVAGHIIRHDPARVLRLVAAHREILELCVQANGGAELGEGVSPEQWLAQTVLRQLASGYDSRPGYDEGWRP